MLSKSTQQSEKITTPTHSSWKTLVLVLALAIVFFILMNSSYFFIQLKYYFHHSDNVSSNHASTPQGQTQSKSNILEIPSLNISAPVVYVNESNEKAFQDALVNGVVHFPGTAGPGEAGNDYIFGHSSDYAFSKGNYKTVFALLPRIEIGALINISNSEGRRFTYKVTDKFVVSPKDVGVLAQDNAKHILTLQTSYPIGTALRRYIVVSELQE